MRIIMWLIAVENAVAFYLCQHLGDHELNTIAEYFGFEHIGSVSYITNSLRSELQENKKLHKELEALS